MFAVSPLIIIFIVLLLSGPVAAAGRVQSLSARLLLVIAMVVLLQPCICSVADAFYISTFADGGSSLVDGVAATTASFNLPYQTWIDTSETFLYVAELYNCRVRQVSLVANTVTTFAGTGISCGSAVSAGDGLAATAATLYLPFGIGGDSVGRIFISEFYTRVYVVNASSSGSNSRIIQTYAGSGNQGSGGDGGLGAAATAQLYAPYYVAVDTGGNLFIADNNNHKIRKVQYYY